MTVLKKIVLVSATLAAMAAYAAVPSTPSEHFGIEVSIVPVDGRPGYFSATTHITDLDRNVVIGKPSLVFAANGATIETGQQGEGQWSLRLGVTADAGSQVATYDALITRDNKVISKQRVAVRLQKEL